MYHRFDPNIGLCPICKERGTQFEEREEHDYKSYWLFEIKCPRCGIFEMDNGRRAPQIALSEEERTILSGLIRRFVDETGGIYPLNAIKEYKTNILSANPPKDVIDRIDIFLSHAASKAPHIGIYTDDSENAWRARLFMPKSTNFAMFVKAIESEGFINIRSPQYGAVSLTLKGWEKVREIKQRKSIDSNQVFVAMWFHPEMNEVFDSGIFPAIDKTGLRPYRVDRNPSENRIDYEIMAQIRKSRFLIADVTGERTGVYYEAGFAQGIGIPVIWSCNKSWSTKLIESPKPNSSAEPVIETATWKSRMHFDTRQFPHILWDSAEDLMTQLISNIQGRGLNLK